MIWFVGFSVLAGLAFTLFPEIDLALARLFWLPDRESFMIWNPFARFVLIGIDIVSYALLLVFYPILLVLTLLARDGSLHRWRRQIVFVVASGFLGPIVVVNWIIKEISGRARPRNLEIFGGEAEFTPPFEIADQCITNCAFVSGHASFAFYFLVFAMLLSGRRRTVVMVLIIAFGLAVGLARMMMGGHFFSDIVFAGIVVYLIGWVLYQAIIVRDGLDFIWNAGPIRTARHVAGRIPRLSAAGDWAADAIFRMETFVLRRRENG